MTQCLCATASPSGSALAGGASASASASPSASISSCELCIMEPLLSGAASAASVGGEGGEGEVGEEDGEGGGGEKGGESEPLGGRESARRCFFAGRIETSGSSADYSKQRPQQHIGTRQASSKGRQADALCVMKMKKRKGVENLQTCP